MALARNSDIFAAGVDLNGIHDWTADHTQAHWLLDRDSYETPPDLAQALETAWRSSPVYYMNTWKSPVFLIHGDDDRNVRFSQTVDLAERLRKAKTESTSAESEEGRLLIKENTFPSGTFPTRSGCVRVPRVGECADKLHAWPLFICDKSRMR